MLTYKQWDTIADAYIPSLALIYFMLIAYTIYQRQYGLALTYFAMTLLCSVVVYSLMFIDNAMHIWPRFNLDYSTHTALALVFVQSIWQIISNVKIFTKIFLILSFVSYLLLMKWMAYHSVRDMLTTILVLIPFFVTLTLLFKHKFRVNN